MIKSTFLHLRIPFSFFLMPVYLFAWAISPHPDLGRVIISFLAIHLFLYPASNGFNSYFDKDEKSIGGLKSPPPVNKSLYWTSISFDLVAILLGLLINIHFSIMLLLYGLASKAYSHPSIRLKRMPIRGWLIVGFFQGFFTFLMSYFAINEIMLPQLLNAEVVAAAALTSLMLWGSYPMTQIYQHEEDSRRGDYTLSVKLGVLGTFHFTAIAFSIATALYFWYFLHFQGWLIGSFYILFLLPVLYYFLRWYLSVRRDESKADFKRTMGLNMISSIQLNAFYLTAGILIH